VSDNHAMLRLRAATAADSGRIRRLVIGAGLFPLDLNWRRFIVAEDGRQVVGCVQMRRHRGADELGSLVVARSQRGRGVARLLIERLLEGEPGPVYLICAERLEPFYRRFGFNVVNDGLPSALRRKREAGRFFRLPIVCMVRR